MENLLEKIVSLCKRRGFIYPGSEIYGGLANTWDYGPLGIELKNNIRDLWWKKFVQNREDIYGLDGGILLHPKTWEASGHIANFSDMLRECKKCHKRFRTDQLETTCLRRQEKCPDCDGELTEAKKFSGLFKTFVGPVETSASTAYLRPETAQAIFINFKNVVDSFHPKLPFGIAQFGKAFRNEMTAGNFIFRDLEFEQMEIEYFFDSKKTNWEKVFDNWQKEMLDWARGLGIKEKNLRFREHEEKERSHYSKKTIDVEYNFPFGVKELYGLAYRTDYDLKQHTQFSGMDLSYQDETGKNVLPHVIEPSFGMPRTILAVLCESYREEEKRVILALPPKLAPYKAAIFPLVPNKEEIVKKAREVCLQLKKEYNVAWDDRGNIGKRYYAQDEIGTPFCVTIDYQTMEDETVTVRDRDTMKQERIPTEKLTEYIRGGIMN